MVEEDEKVQNLDKLEDSKGLIFMSDIKKLSDLKGFEEN